MLRFLDILRGWGVEDEGGLYKLFKFSFFCLQCTFPGHVDTQLVRLQ